MSHGNSKGERRDNGVEAKYEDCKKMTVKVQLTFLSGLGWRNRTQRRKTGLGPLSESRQEDEGPDADGSWESGRKWTNLRSTVGDADWTRPPTWALVSQPHSRVQCCLQGSRCSLFTLSWGRISHLPSMPPPGSKSPLRFDHSFDKVTVESKEPHF